MIIAWCLEDMRSFTGGKKGVRTLYEAKGRVVRVICMDDNMAILENRKGERFPANKNRLIWHDTRSPET